MWNDIITMLQNEVPDECAHTIFHAKTHLEQAEKSLDDKDLEQAAHDLFLAGAILLLKEQQLQEQLKEQRNG